MTSNCNSGTSEGEGHENTKISYWCCCCASPLDLDLDKNKNKDTEDTIKTTKTAENDIVCPAHDLDVRKEGDVDVTVDLSYDKPPPKNSDPKETVTVNESKASTPPPAPIPNPALVLADIHILATVFEFPYLIRNENTIFETETEEFEICQKCDSVLSQLYPLYVTFTELLKDEGKIWKTLQKIGKEQEPLQPMLVYDNDDADDDNFNDPDFEFNHAIPAKRSRKGNNASGSRKRRPRKVPPKRLSMCLTDSEIEVVDEIVHHPKKRAKKRKTPISKPKPKQIIKYSSEEMSEGGITFDEKTDPEDNDFQFVDVADTDEEHGVGVGSDIPSDIGEGDPDYRPKHKTVFVEGEEAEGPENALLGHISTLQDESNSNSNNVADNDNSGHRSHIKTLRGRSVRVKLDASLATAPTRKSNKFKTFVDGVRKKAKANAEAKAKSKRGRKKNPDGVKKPRVRKPDTRKRIRKSWKECLKEVKEGDPTRQCDVCGKLFVFPRLLNHHKLTVHEKKKPYECKSCGKGFTQKFILKKHLCDYSQLPETERDFLILEREAKLRMFQCDLCPKTFKGNSQLVLHKQNHRDDRPFKCEKCPKTFRRHDHLAKHDKAVHTDGQRFVCSVCGQTFKIRASMRAHEKRHNLPKETHVCTVCGKSFDSILVVRRHQMTHDETLPFACEICGKRFKMKDYLGQHLRKGKSCKPGMSPRESQPGAKTKSSEKQSSDSNVKNVYNENPSSLSVGLGSSASTSSAPDHFVHQQPLAHHLPMPNPPPHSHGHNSHSHGHGHPHPQMHNMMEFPFNFGLSAFDNHNRSNSNTDF